MIIVTSSHDYRDVILFEKAHFHWKRVPSTRKRKASVFQIPPLRFEARFRKAPFS